MKKLKWSLFLALGLVATAACNDKKEPAAPVPPTAPVTQQDPPTPAPKPSPAPGGGQGRESIAVADKDKVELPIAPAATEIDKTEFLGLTLKRGQTPGVIFADGSFVKEQGQVEALLNQFDLQVDGKGSHFYKFDTNNVKKTWKDSNPDYKHMNRLSERTLAVRAAARFRDYKKNSIVSHKEKGGDHDNQNMWCSWGQCRPGEALSFDGDTADEIQRAVDSYVNAVRGRLEGTTEESILQGSYYTFEGNDPKLAPIVKIQKNFRSVIVDGDETGKSGHSRMIGGPVLCKDGEQWGALGKCGVASVQYMQATGLVDKDATVAEKPILMSVFMGNGNHYEGLSKVRNIEDVIALLSLPQSLLDQPVGTQFLYFQVDPTKAELTIDAAFLFEVVDKNG